MNIKVKIYEGEFYLQDKTGVSDYCDLSNKFSTISAGLDSNA